MFRHSACSVLLSFALPMKHSDRRFRCFSGEAAPERALQFSLASLVIKTGDVLQEFLEGVLRRANAERIIRDARAVACRQAAQLEQVIPFAQEATRDVERD